MPADPPRVEFHIEAAPELTGRGHAPGRIIGGDGPLLIDGTGHTRRHLVDSGGVALMSEHNGSWSVNFEGDWHAFVKLAKDILCNEEEGYRDAR